MLLKDIKALVYNIAHNMELFSCRNPNCDDGGPVHESFCTYCDSYVRPICSRSSVVKLAKEYLRIHRDITEEEMEKYIERLIVDK
jgi:hypothetical protein